MNYDTNFTEYVCNEPRRQGSTFYDPDFLDVNSQKSKTETIIDYVTSCCHKDVEKRKFLLRFEPEFKHNCEKPVQDDRRRCKNFWKLIDSDPLFGALIKDGTFIHENRPVPDKSKVNQDCCSMSQKNLNDGGGGDGDGKTCQNPYVNKIRENRAMQREAFQKQREKSKQLHLKSGQKLIHDTQKSGPSKKESNSNIYSDMTGDDVDEEMASLNAFNPDPNFKWKKAIASSSSIKKQAEESESERQLLSLTGTVTSFASSRKSKTE